MSNSGLSPRAVQPTNSPAPNAPSEPPPEIARKLIWGRAFFSRLGRVAFTCAHFSAARESILSGARSPQYRTCTSSITAAWSASAGGTASRGNEEQLDRQSAIGSDSQNGLHDKQPITLPRAIIRLVSHREAKQ